jgi:hypothetical protein
MTLRGVSSQPNYIGSFAYASLPAASSNSGLSAMASDYGPAPGIRVISDGTNWVPMGVQVLHRAGIPVGLAPSGTMANNGAVTLGTALPSAYASCYLHFPASAIVAGSAAGLYYTIMSSTTVGTVYNNTYTSGIPTIPTSPTAFATTGPGAFTASTARTTLISVTLPGGLMGLNGSLDAESLWTATNNANAKTPFFVFGGGADIFPQAPTSVVSSHDQRLITNRGSASAQVAVSAGASGGWGISTAAPVYMAVNTAADVTLKWDATKATATDWMGVEAFRIMVYA